MSELYEDIKKWVLSLPEDAIVGTPMKSANCLVALFLGRPLVEEDFNPDSQKLPADVINLTVDFDYLARDAFPERTPITAKVARELFCKKEKESLTSEGYVLY